MTRDILELIEAHYGYLISWLSLLKYFLQPGSQLQASCNVDFRYLFATEIIQFSVTLTDVIFCTPFQIKSLHSSSEAAGFLNLPCPNRTSAWTKMGLVDRMNGSTLG